VDAEPGEMAARPRVRRLDVPGRVARRGRERPGGDRSHRRRVREDDAPVRDRLQDAISRGVEVSHMPS